MNALYFLSLLCLAAARPQFGPVIYHSIPGASFYSGSFQPQQQVFHTLRFPTTPLVKVAAAPTTFVHAIKPVVQTYSAPIATPIAQPIVRPVVTPAVAPVVTPVVDVPAPTFRKFHSQAADGTYEFGYSGGPSSRHEIKDTFGVVRGAYNYVDPVGDVQSGQYVADAAGFRVAATNLPVAVHEEQTPVEDTLEVKAAKAEHFAAKSRSKRSVSKFQFPASTSPLFKTITQSFGNPTYYSTPSVTPTFYNSVRYNTLPIYNNQFYHQPRAFTQVVNNPGIAHSYYTAY